MSQSHPATPCRTCQVNTYNPTGFCSTECAEEYDVATKPCPDCHHVGWDCVCDDAFTITEDRPCPNCGQLDYPCSCGRDEMIEHQFDDLPSGDYYDDGYEEPDCPW